MLIAKINKEIINLMLFYSDNIIQRHSNAALYKKIITLARLERAAMGGVMPVIAQTIFLLTISNMFMLSAWYVHLKFLGHRAWYIAAIASWGIAFFEYTVHIPANRIGFAKLSLSQLQILQTTMSLVIFIPFSFFAMGHTVKLDYLWASLCLIGAAYFIFRGFAVA